MFYAQRMLIDAIKEQDLFLDVLFDRCGKTPMFSDVKRFFDRVRDTMTLEEFITDQRLKNRRILFTRWCSKEQVEAATTIARNKTHN